MPRLSLWRSDYKASEIRSAFVLLAGVECVTNHFRKFAESIDIGNE